MIREATLQDVPAIVDLGRLALSEGPYKGALTFNEKQATQFASSVIRFFGKVLLWEEEGAVVGLLAILIFPHFFSGEMTAQEVMWYVRPEWRHIGAAIKLMWAGEALAKENGVKQMQFTAPTTDVGKLYERFGYKQIEVGYQKDLCRH